MSDFSDREVLKFERKLRSDRWSRAPVAPEDSDCISKVKAMMLLGFAGAKEGDMVLDAGVGYGDEYTMRLLVRKITVIGVDFVLPLLKMFKVRCHTNGYDNAKIALSDICHLPFRSESFDKVISAQVIQHLPSPVSRNAAFLEISRVLKPDGIFVMETLNEYFLMRLASNLLTMRFPPKVKEILADPSKAHRYRYFYNRSELIKELSKYFVDVRVVGMHTLFPLHTFVREFLLGRYLQSKFLAKAEHWMDTRLPSHLYARSLVARCRGRRDS